LADDLKVALTATLSNSAIKILDGVADHVYTVLSISFCETASADELLDLYINDDAGGTLYYIYKGKAIAADTTVFHDKKIVMLGTDELTAVLASAGDVDVVVSYLDQS
jgi:hypothetical protein